MSAFTPASEVLLRHSDDFEQSRILFAGDLQDDLPARLDTAASRAHTQQFHHWQVLSRQMGDNARFSLVATADDVADCDTLIYYWPKNKPEAQFQLMNLLSLLPVGTDIFVVGENRSGVRSAEQMLADYAPLNKVDSARRCGLYFGRLEKQPEFDAHEHEQMVRMAGIRLAAFVGQLAVGQEEYESEEYTWDSIGEKYAQYPDLPRVAYVQMLQSQGLLHDTYVYGVDAKKTLPTILSPTEIMDGAIVSGNCVSACDKNPTYVHENNPVVHDLFEEHGKTLNFVCQIITNENVYLADKERSSDWTAKLCKMLDLDGVIVSQEGFGNPDTDLIMNCKKIEAEGIKTVIITDEYAGRDGKSQSLADADVAADAVVTGGNANEVVILPKLDKVIGTLDYVTKIAGASEDTLREDGSLEVELQVITGATNETGFNKLSAR